MMAAVDRVSAKLAGETEALEKKALESMKKNGLIIHEAPADSLAKWKEAADKGMDELVGKVFSKEIYEQLLQILQEYQPEKMKFHHIRKAGRSLETLLAFFTIFLLALIPNLEVIARRFFHTGIRNSTEYTHHLVLILAFIAAAITSRENRHLSLALNLEVQAGDSLPAPANSTRS